MLCVTPVKVTGGLKGICCNNLSYESTTLTKPYYTHVMSAGAQNHFQLIMNRGRMHFRSTHFTLRLHQPESNKPVSPCIQGIRMPWVTRWVGMHLGRLVRHTRLTLKNPSVDRCEHPIQHSWNSMTAAFWSGWLLLSSDQTQNHHTATGNDLDACS